MTFESDFIVYPFLPSKMGTIERQDKVGSCIERYITTKLSNTEESLIASPTSRLTHDFNEGRIYVRDMKFDSTNSRIQNISCIRISSDGDVVYLNGFKRTKSPRPGRKSLRLEQLRKVKGI